MEERARILLIEDDLRISDLIQRALSEDNKEVAIIHDGKTALEYIRINDLDLIITDIILPKINGIQFCKEARMLFPNLPIIMLTALGTTDDKVDGFDAGADDYLVKPFEIRELLARINVLLRKSSAHQLKQVDVLYYDDLVMNLQTKTVNRQGKNIVLTPKEFSLMEFFLKNPERVLSRNEIAEKVWGTNFDTGTNFIDVYINYLRKKIDKDFSVKLIHTKPGMGFMLMK